MRAESAENERLARENTRLVEEAAAQEARVAELESHQKALAACQAPLETEKRRRGEAEAALETARAALKDERLEQWNAPPVRGEPQKVSPENRAGCMSAICCAAHLPGGATQ